jgi:hypothetical protein
MGFVIDHSDLLALTSSSFSDHCLEVPATLNE